MSRMGRMGEVTEGAGRRAPARPLRRGVQLMAGLVLYAASIAALVHAGLGNMPWDVLSQGLSHRLGWSFGTVTIVLSVLVLGCWIPLRQRPGVGTVLNVLVIGLLVDPFLALLGRLGTPPLGVAVALTAGGIVLNGLATALYIGTRLGPGPRDGLMTGLVSRTGWSVRLVRSGIEVVVVAVGWVLGGTVGLGTLAYAVGIGPLVHVLLPRFTVPLERTTTGAGAGTDGPGGDRTGEHVAECRAVEAG